MFTQLDVYHTLKILQSSTFNSWYLFDIYLPPMKQTHRCQNFENQFFPVYFFLIWSTFALPHKCLKNIISFIKRLTVFVNVTPDEKNLSRVWVPFCLDCLVKNGANDKCTKTLKHLSRPSCVRQ
jgi:hypothetical protein